MAKRSKAQRAAAARKGWITRRNQEELDDIEDLLGEEFENVTQAREALEYESTQDVDRETEPDQAKWLLWHLIEQSPRRSQSLENLFNNHYGDKGYDFLAEEGILKVSIGTTKTRKKFSVRLN